MASRRQVLAGLGAIGAAVLRPVRVLAQPAVAGGGEPLRRIGEIVSRDGRLRAELTMSDVQRLLPGDDEPRTLRAFGGIDLHTGSGWPPPDQSGVMNPGPTLRAKVGDFVEIKLFNEVDTSSFGDDGIDLGETGADDGCEVTVDVESGETLYPIRADAFPNCFHGSSTSNVHFHGFHVTPDGLGDNVLLKVRPWLDLPKDQVRAAFETVFAQTRAGTPPAGWLELPPEWIGLQTQLLAAHDADAEWQGVQGALPEEMRLLPAVQAQVAAGLWPQYQVGAYPFSFQITPAGGDANSHAHGGAVTGAAAGQAPGTHWYHAHVHGSTAINLLQGMAGVFVVEGDSYDGALRALLPGLVEHVLIVQQFAEYPWRVTGRRVTLLPHVNGQRLPVLEMRPGEVQLWRLVNASVDMVASIGGFAAASPAVPLPAFMQSAQDGIQFSPAAFAAQPFGQPGNRIQNFAPGNRIDLLVRAPLLPEGTAEATFDFTLRHDPQTPMAPELLRVRVTGAPAAMELPTQAQFPTPPSFLADIGGRKAPRITRELVFSEPTSGNATAAGPRIDGKEFEDGRYDQTIVLGDTEDWTLRNASSTAAHPFHIHVNPFQVIEVGDPQGTTVIENAFVWQDTVAIPRNGHVKIRHRFDDFTGSFVLHCHLLEHEDRGMMQFVRVISPNSPVRHH